MRRRVLWLEEQPVGPPLARMVGAGRDSEFWVSHIRSAEEALARAANQLFDLVVLDIANADLATGDLVRCLADSLPSAPVIVLLRHDDPEAALRLVEAGADECRDRSGVGARELLRLFRHAVARRSELARLDERQYDTRFQTSHDRLTMLPNRALLLDQMEHELAAARRHGWNLALHRLDLDGLRRLNDRRGPSAGDRLLAATAAELRAVARHTDIVARWDVDEFAVLQLHLRELDGVAILARRLLEAAARAGRLHDPTRGVVAAIGAAVFPNDGRTPDLLVENAERALAAARLRGGGSGFASESSRDSGPST